MSHLSKHSLLVGMAAVASLGLAACGTTEAAVEESAPASAVVVTDARGEEVTIPADVTDIVALEWNAVEQVQTVGINPIGVADVAGYTD